MNAGALLNTPDIDWPGRLAALACKLRRQAPQISALLGKQAAFVSGNAPSTQCGKACDPIKFTREAQAPCTEHRCDPGSAPRPARHPGLKGRPRRHAKRAASAWVRRGDTLRPPSAMLWAFRWSRHMAAGMRPRRAGLIASQPCLPDVVVLAWLRRAPR